MERILKMLNGSETFNISIKKKIIVAVIYLCLLYGGFSLSLIAGQKNVFPLVDGKFKSAEGIEFNAEGRLFVTADKALWEVYVDGSVRRVCDLFSALGIAPVGKRDLYVADFGPTSIFSHREKQDPKDGIIWRITPEGKKNEFSKGIADPNFIYLNRDGSMYVSDDGTNKIYMVDPKGNISLFSDAIYHPNGLWVSADEQFLYVAQIFKSLKPFVRDNRLWRIPLNERKNAGKPEVVFETGGIGGNDGITMDNRGRVYIAANKEGRIWRYDPKTKQSALIAENPNGFASIAFGRGKFDPKSLYATVLRGGQILRIPTDSVGCKLNH